MTGGHDDAPAGLGNAGPLVVAVLDADLRYVSVSEAWTHVVSQTAEHLVGSSVSVAVGTTPELIDALRQSLSGAVCEIAPEGPQRWTTIPRVDSHGQITGVAILQESCGEVPFAQSALRLEAALETAGIGVFEKDFTSGEVRQSGAIEDILGMCRPVTSIEAILARASEADWEALKTEKATAVDPAGDGRFSITLSPVVDGAQKTIEVMGRVLFAGEGTDRHPKAAIGVVLDRTESNRATWAMADAQRLQTLGRMAGMIAHDFNNLLTVILSNLEMLEVALRDHQAHHHVVRAIDATNLGSSFNQRLLSLAGSRTRNPSVFALDAHLVRTWAMIQRALGEKVHARFQPGAGDASIEMDGSELDAAVLNLVVNARDAIRGSGVVRISTGAVSLSSADLADLHGGRPGQFVWIRVADNGTGMSPETVARAAEPFFSTKGRERGTGLGLTGVGNTMARCQGFVDIRSREGDGTEVTLYIPQSPLNAKEEADEREAELPLGDGELILVVEDDAMVREATLDRLEALGYAVLEAADVPQAKEVITRGEPIDMVFSDVILPGDHNGCELATWLAESRPDIPITLTTGHTSTQIARAIADKEACPIALQKPYSIAALAEAMADALKSRPLAD